MSVLWKVTIYRSESIPYGTFEMIERLGVDHLWVVHACLVVDSEGDMVKIFDAYTAEIDSFDLKNKYRIVTEQRKVDNY